ncbi:MAG: dTMP kinase [Gammaproteobacteria bacterium]|nr:dTMP kinase [Gammaproteobacteria bacterium]
MQQAGKFITLEGVEGAGKSTSLRYIEQLLENLGVRLVRTREPGGTALGEEVRGLLLSHRDEGITSTSELLLMYAARAEHIERIIQPALARGDWVLCDRFADASFAYQGGGRGIDYDHIRELHQWVMGDFGPDLTLLLDLPVTLGLRRAARRSQPDRFETESQAFFERVRSAYWRIAREDPDRVKIVDSSRPRAEVEQQIRQIIMNLVAS